MRTPLLTLAFLGLTQFSAPAQAEIRALVIGIDAYDHIPSLDGAVNDARDIAETLQGLGADVTLLVNQDASRDRILSEWRRVANATSSDDLFFVSYAGHGSNEPEFWPDNEFDGRDETLLLSGFAPKGADAAARIRDDEIADLLALSPPENTIFIADACHAGTLSRSVRPVLGYRYFAHGQIVDDPLPPPPPKTAKDEGRGDLGMFLAAVDETAKVPEFLIDGQARGALSYAIANALRGEADTNNDRALTVGEIETYVRRSIRSVSHGLQRPQISRLGGADRVLIALDGASPLNVTSDVPASSEEATPARSPWDLSFDELPELSLASASRAATSFKGTRPGTPADIDITANGTIRSSVGDILGVGESVMTQQRILDKIRLTKHLSHHHGASLLDVFFEGGDKAYCEGDEIVIQVTGRQSKYITLFNIAADGELALLYPHPEYSDPPTLDPGTALSLALGIQLPIGADHVFAIETDRPADALRDAVLAAEGSRDAEAFWEDLRVVLGTQSSDMRIAVFPFFTVSEK